MPAKKIKYNGATYVLADAKTEKLRQHVRAADAAMGNALQHLQDLKVEALEAGSRNDEIASMVEDAYTPLHRAWIKTSLIYHTLNAPE